jgi:hypothetical protein
MCRLVPLLPKPVPFSEHASREHEAEEEEIVHAQAGRDR